MVTFREEELQKSFHTSSKSKRIESQYTIYNIVVLALSPSSCISCCVDKRKKKKKNIERNQGTKRTKTLIPSSFLCSGIAGSLSLADNLS